MKLQIYGARGSVTTGSVKSTSYGSNTSCYGVEIDYTPYIILDAGSGLRSLGNQLEKKFKSKRCAIFLSHGHWDHVMGLPFFTPLYNADWEVDIYVPENIGDVGPKAFLKQLFSSAFFPMEWEQLQSKKRIHSLIEGQIITLGGVNITVCASNHGTPQGEGLYAAGFRIDGMGQSIFYSGDHELVLDDSYDGRLKFDHNDFFFQCLKGVDVALLDSQYTLEDYKNHVGWGHSAIEAWPNVLYELGVKTFMPTHYDPSYDDNKLDQIGNILLKENPFLLNHMCMAHEGLIIDCAQMHASNTVQSFYTSSCVTCAFTAELFKTPDMSSVLDVLLHRARSVCNADAGTIYLVEKGRLVFSYSHNDTLFTRSQSARQQYLNASLPIDSLSIAGHAANTRTVVNIDNVYALSKDMPYTFNDSFDKATGYRTVSMCVLPIIDQNGKLLAVMQIINSMHEGKTVSFSPHMIFLLHRLCNVGADVIAKARYTKDMLMRLLETARMRDPDETGPHVTRVGSMVAELYHHWAEKKNIDIMEITTTKSHLRLAAMLHDVGKVGISDLILKKPGRFTPEERAIMEQHCAIGAAIFKDTNYTLESMAATIALHHHQRWDGNGYGGHNSNTKLAGKDIPLEARLTSICDVFDALISPRCYKDPMPVEKALAIIKKDSGVFFDPELVECFFEIIDVMFAIQKRYAD